MTVLAPRSSHERASRYLQAGWLVIPRDHIFPSPDAARAAMVSLRDAIRCRPLVDDQPGSERHHLDEPVFVSLLTPWLQSGLFLSLCEHLFPDEDVFVKYLRSRNPLHAQGEQALHSDWYVECPGERMEVFVALDEVTLENGPLEIQAFSDCEAAVVTWEAGAMVVMDSVIPHRGTTNRGGVSRQVVSAHVGVHLRSDESVLSYILRRDDVSSATLAVDKAAEMQGASGQVATDGTSKKECLPSERNLK